MENNSSQNHETGLTLEQRLAWLQLYRSWRIGAVVFRELINFHGGAVQAVEALPNHYSRMSGGGGKKVVSRKQAEQEYDALHQIQGQLITAADPAFPPLLRHTVGAPPILSVVGNVSAIAQPAIAAVGTRRASAAATAFCRRVISRVSRSGWVVASGLAVGIDTAAHLSSLTRGTVAVMAGGVDIVYPPSNRNLYKQIQETGAVISEMPIASRPVASHFPRRNRIIAGMSAAVLVFEGAQRSGSLITARMAGEMGREVWAAPGSPLDARSLGTNELLRDGANFMLDAEAVGLEIDEMYNNYAPIFDSNEIKRFTANNGIAGTPQSRSNGFFSSTSDTAVSLFDQAHEDSDSLITSAQSGRLDSTPEIGAKFLPEVDSPPAPSEMDVRASEKTAAKIKPVLIDMISATPVAVDDLIAAFDNDAGAVRLVLIEAALLGQVTYVSGDKVMSVTS